MFDTPIKKSRRLQHIQVIIVLIISLFLVLLTFSLLADGREYLGVDGTALGWITRIVILVVAVAAVIAAYWNGSGRTYEFNDGTLIITDNGFGAKENKRIVSLSSQTVTSLSVEQSMIDKLVGVGTVVITVDGNTNENEYRIEGIDYPDEFLANLNAYLHNKNTA